MSQDAQDTNKLSRVTDEMLQTFSNKEEKVAEESSVIDPSVEETDKTVVEFSEDEAVPKTEENSEKPKKNGFFLKGLLIILLIAFVGTAIFGIWNRWFRYNDEEQIVSNWQLNGSNAVVAIDNKHLTLNPNAVLEYTLDPVSKVINYKIGDKTGQSHYRFSWDRNQLAIVENTACDPVSTILSDLGWFWDWATCGMSGIDLSPSYTKNNKNEVDTENTGLDDIMNNGKTESVLLDRIPTKKTNENL